VSIVLYIEFEFVCIIEVIYPIELGLGGLGSLGLLGLLMVKSVKLHRSAGSDWLALRAFLRMPWRRQVVVAQVETESRI
jgi:hypothetical protein